ncbi:MAG: dihydrodipicolinate synthase family protein [Cyclonatronaceae bacterium]
MDLIQKLTGIIGVINTPFGTDGNVHVPSLANYISHSLDAGVCGFLTLGMAAETPKLSLQERVLIVETVVKNVQGRVPVIAGVSADTQEERVRLARQFNGMGCDAIMVNVPFTNREAYLNDIHELDETNPGFMMVQDWEFKGFGLPVDLIVKMFASIPSFKSLKVEVAPAGVKYSDVLKATAGKLHVTGGWAATQMIEALDRGVHAFMPTILHPVYIRIFALHRLGNRQKAVELFNRVLPVLSFSHQHPDICIHFNKRLVCKQGLFITDSVRGPVLTFDSWHERIADELIAGAIMLNEETIQKSVKQL